MKLIIKHEFESNGGAFPFKLNMGVAFCQRFFFHLSKLEDFISFHHWKCVILANFQLPKSKLVIFLFDLPAIYLFLSFFF